MMPTMFMAALFEITRTRKQPECPLTVEQTKKVMYIYTIEYYSEVKYNDILKFECKQMELEKNYE